MLESTRQTDWWHHLPVISFNERGKGLEGGTVHKLRWMQTFTTRWLRCCLTIETQTAWGAHQLFMQYQIFSAVVLTIHLTNAIPSLGRFPINFKSEIPPTGRNPTQQHKYFYHVVLGLALGKHLPLNSVTRCLE